MPVRRIVGCIEIFLNELRCTRNDTAAIVELQQLPHRSYEPFIDSIAFNG